MCRLPHVLWMPIKQFQKSMEEVSLLLLRMRFFFSFLASDVCPWNFAKKKTSGSMRSTTCAEECIILCRNKPPTLKTCTLHCSCSIVEKRGKNQYRYQYSRYIPSQSPSLVIDRNQFSFSFFHFPHFLQEEIFGWNRIEELVVSLHFFSFACTV